MVKDKGKKATLQQISDVAWLVRQGKNKLGILNKDVQNHYFYINGKEAVSFLKIIKESLEQPKRLFLNI